jgi:hypothetical protein
LFERLGHHAVADGVRVEVSEVCWIAHPRRLADAIHIERKSVGLKREVGGREGGLDVGDGHRVVGVDVLERRVNCPTTI